MYYPYRRTLTSNGKEVSSANQVVDFVMTDPIDGDKLDFSVAYLSIETFDKDLRIKFNNEENVHTLFSNRVYPFKDFEIEKFTILDAGVEFYYTAFIPTN